LIGVEIFFCLSLKDPFKRGAALSSRAKARWALAPRLGAGPRGHMHPVWLGASAAGSDTRFMSKAADSAPLFIFLTCPLKILLTCPLKILSLKNPPQQPAKENLLLACPLDILKSLLKRQFLSEEVMATNDCHRILAG
jgi:hypothetical protein